MKKNSKLPVLVLSGFLGSGKTSLINKMLTNNQNIKFALIINDIGEVNIDAEILRKTGLEISTTTENIVEISNGCICCTLREDLLIEVKKIYEQGKYDYLVIESSGVSEPIPVAQTFTFDDGSKLSLDKITKLDCMLTTIDCSTFLEYLDKDKQLSKLDMVAEGDDRMISELIIEQIEFSNVLLLSKTDLISSETLSKIKTILSKLNPSAKIIESKFGDIDFKEILNTNMFDFDIASSQAGWIKELEKPMHTPETVEFGITTFVYKSRKPFNRTKLNNLINSNFFNNIIRSKGYYWLQDDQLGVYEFSKSGQKILYNNSVGSWWAAVNKEDWPVSSSDVKRIESNFIEPYYEIGDRRQELVFIGQNTDYSKITSALDLCTV